MWHQRYLSAAAAGHAEEADDALGMAVDLLDGILGQLDAEVRAAAAARVPEHRRIHEARERSLVVRASASLPRIDIPIGRPLRDDDMVEVRWTVSEPGDAAFTDPKQRRRTRVARLGVEAADQGGAPRVGDLAEALGVSVATVRRDLAALREAGTPVPTRGHR